LDRETSGIVLVAKEHQAAIELRRIWEMREVEKAYCAIVHGHVAQDAGVIDAPLGRDEASMVAIKDKVRPDGAVAQTAYSVLSRFTRPEGDFTLVEARPFTGRKHQIRIHLAHVGHPIVGDKLYGLDESFYLDFVKYRLTDEQRKRLILTNQALHAREVRFAWRGEERCFRAEAEAWFTEFAATGSGDRGRKTPACE
jgi:23S rRNA pseudouridine1911/1915/1917 synthase